MLHIRILGILLLLAAVVLPGRALAMELKPGQSYSFEGVIDAISPADSRLVLKRTSPTVAKTVTVKVDDRTQITLNKQPTTFAELAVGDKIWTSFVDGVASKIAVTRDPAPAPAAK
ncbi:MAG: hypothetical protein H0X38_03600 [Planctomycetes bacterium]|nr:hypothetical protein [Planctomycetota bacterium]